MTSVLYLALKHDMRQINEWTDHLITTSLLSCRAWQTVQSDDNQAKFVSWTTVSIDMVLLCCQPVHPWHRWRRAAEKDHRAAGYWLRLGVEDVFNSVNILQPRQCDPLQEKKSPFFFQWSPRPAGWSQEEPYDCCGYVDQLVWHLNVLSLRAGISWWTSFMSKMFWSLQ